jgi:quercetin dioxygenase-like cupin family protein
MAGGVVRQVTRGDVLIIPANVTHWFKEIQQPITYFGVKGSLRNWVPALKPRGAAVG